MSGSVAAPRLPVGITESGINAPLTSKSGVLVGVHNIPKIERIAGRQSVRGCGDLRFAHEQWG